MLLSLLLARHPFTIFDKQNVTSHYGTMNTDRWKIDEAQSSAATADSVSLAISAEQCIIYSATIVD